MIEPTAYIDIHTNLDKTINRAIDISWSQETDQAHFEQLTKELQVLTEIVMEIGAENFKQLDEQDNPAFYHYYVCYEWMEQAKGFLLLWRDILFQEQKAWLKLSAREIDPAQYNHLKESSKNVLYAAAEELQQFLIDNTNNPINPDKQIGHWKLQDNPWNIYKEQIPMIPTQGKELLTQSKVLWNTSGNFVLIYSHFTDVYQKYLHDIDELKTDLKSLLLQQKEESFDEHQLISQLEVLNKKYNAPDYITNFGETLEEEISTLPKKKKYSVGTEHGMLLYKEIDLQKETRFWLNSELMADFYNLNTIQESISNKINLSIVNIKNRLNLENQEEAISVKEESKHILTNFIKSLEKSQEAVTNLKTRTETQLQENFHLTYLYEDNFLARSLQQTITQYRDYQLQNWQYVRNWFGARLAAVKRFQQSVRDEEALSISEKMVRLVRSRTPQADNNHYTTMFLTSGWVGDSFTIGRVSELKQVENLVDNWKLGFRGALMVTGKRFSGKTLFGEIIGQRFFKTVIKLKPNHKIHLAGRYFDVQYELEEVLEFISNYSLGTSLMVWVDDLELWQDEKISLSENISALLHTIDDTSGRIFFVVGLSNWLKKHLDNVHEMDKVFQSEINMDRMAMEEIAQAIFIRHSATNMDLVNEDKEEVAANKIRKKVNKIYRHSEGNIGEALHQWAYSIQKDNEENVVFNDTPYYTLPEFMSMDSALILKAVMMDKHTNEYHLRKLFGPAFKQQYKIILQRLFHLGILKRTGNGFEINPFIVNDIGKVLEKKIDFEFGSNKLTKENTKL